MTTSGYSGTTERVLSADVAVLDDLAELIAVAERLVADDVDAVCTDDLMASSAVVLVDAVAALRPELADHLERYVSAVPAPGPPQLVRDLLLSLRLVHDSLPSEPC